MKLPRINKCDPKIFDQDRRDFKDTCTIASAYTARLNIFGYDPNDSDMYEIISLAEKKGYKKLLKRYQDEEGDTDGGTYNGIHVALEYLGKKYPKMQATARECKLGDDFFKEAIGNNLPIIVSIKYTHRGYADKSRDGVIDEKDHDDYSGLLHQVCITSSDKPEYDRMHLDTFPGDNYYNIYYVEDGYSRTNRYEDTCYVIIPETKEYNEELYMIEMIEIYLRFLKIKHDKKWGQPTDD